eukprot:3939615-Rhodomonas_salina.2
MYPLQASSLISVGFGKRLPMPRGCGLHYAIDPNHWINVTDDALEVHPHTRSAPTRHYEQALVDQ